MKARKGNKTSYAENTGSAKIEKEAAERNGGRVKDEAKVEGKMSKMRLDRPGRKTGGRVGADTGPMSSAAKNENRSC